MFSPEDFDDIMEQLRAEWGYLPPREWEDLVRSLHLAMAQAEAGVPFAGNVDPRVIAILERRIEPPPLTAEDLER